MENPLTLKVGQVFTGFGVGCGIGIGVGQPIPFGSIPALQQVLSAARGATDIFSGATRHVNGFLKTKGMKNIEAGVGCGVGIGHGFGVGLALKPGVVHRIQSSLVQAVAKIMTNLGVTPNISSLQSVIPGSVASSIGMLSAPPCSNVQIPMGSSLDFESKTSGSMFHQSATYESSSQKPMRDYNSVGNQSEMPVRTHAEKVVTSFLQNPILNNEDEMELNELAANLRSESNVLRVLLKHQKAIEELMEENRRMRGVLVEELKVSASKLQSGNGVSFNSNYTCSDCFECRRRRRKSAR